jgi:hypothetical protein
MRWPPRWVQPVVIYWSIHSLAKKRSFIEKAWCSETATQQLNPPSKQKAESITCRTNGCEWNGNGQHLDGQKVLQILSHSAVELTPFIKKPRKGATHTEAKDNPCEGTEPTAV